MLRRFTKRWFWHPLAGIATSFALHTVAVAAVVGCLIWGLLADMPVPAAPALLSVQTRQEAIEVSPLTVAPSKEFAAPVLDAEELLSGISDPRWQELVEPVEGAHADSASVFVSTQLMRIAREAEQRSADDNLQRLEELSGRLATVSSHENVGDINAQLRKVLRTEERAERPANEPIAGDFDFATAQLHDVLRVQVEDGKFTFTAILVDAEGRKFESPMSQADGGTAYRTMQLIKSNPLLEKVYRGLVMSMLDKMLKAAQ
jgi:hypothetical protein